MATYKGAGPDESSTDGCEDDADNEEERQDTLWGQDRSNGVGADSQ